jgi:hypothetical protein
MKVLILQHSKAEQGDSRILATERSIKGAGSYAEKMSLKDFKYTQLPSYDALVFFRRT